MGNEQNSAGQVLNLEANSEVFGGVAIDGAGRLTVGQASGPWPTSIYLANAFNDIKPLGTTGLVQYTRRELPAG